jgi:hypothetical protein
MRGFWIGLTDLFHEDRWIWAATDSGPSYTNWYGGEPNNQNGTEHFAQLHPKRTNRTWNDNSNRKLIWALCQYQL